MKLSLKLLFVCSVLVSSAFAQNMTGYNLVFEDDFNGTALDETVWNIEVNGEGGGNGELQYYRRENVSVGRDPQTGESALILTAKKENFTGPVKPPTNMGNVTKPSTSGRIMSKNKMHYRYGVIEARIKFPYTANGLWPAFWMMGNNGGWPACGEIDIIEMGHATAIAEGSSARRFSGWFHWGTSWDMYGPGAYPNTGSNKYPNYDVQGSYHIWRLEWDENNMRMYFDNETQPYAQLGIDGNGPANTGTYFRQSFFVLFNLAVGGHYPFPNNNNIGNVTAFANTPGGEPKMYVDYVRVYQKGNANDQYTGPSIGPPAPVSGVTLNKNTTSITVNATEQLTANVQPTNAGNKNVTWSSSNNNIATVNNGLVTAKAVGTATITVTTVEGNKTDICTVTVTPEGQVLPGTNLALNKPIQSSDDANDLAKATAAVDGNDGTRWESKHGEDNKTLTIDLQNMYSLNEVVINWEGAFASQFDVQVSENGTNWTTIQSNVTGKLGEQEIAINNVNARYVRIVCKTRETIYGFSIWEVEVYGSNILTELSVNAIQEISLYPNPVEDILYIQSGTTISGIILSDLNGRKLFESNDANNIDMSAYSTGMYLLTIKAANGETVVKKIVKK